MTFRDLPIRRKLLVLTLVSSAPALLLASSGFLAWDILQLRTDIRQDIATQTAVLADNSAAPLTFQDRQAATETLAVMRLRSRVAAACLYAANGTPFASYLRDTAASCPAQPPTSTSESWSRYDVNVPVTLRNDRVGTLYIDRDLDDVYDRLRVGGIAVGSLLLVAIAAALLIARRIQASIASPLLALADTARAISTGHEDSVRATSAANDEIGVVVDAFNAMLDRVRQRSQELSRANTELEHANRLKDEFLATLSHELRTPLNAVLGWTRVLRATGHTEPSQERALETIERNARAQARLIEDLLEVSRIVSGKLRIQPRPVDLAGIVDRAVDVVQTAASAKRIAFTTEILARPAVTSGDPDRLQQVIWNVVANAVKFTPAGGAVAVRLTAQDGFLIEVRDTGIGIESRFLPHVFEAFRQADGSVSREHGGLGLGLAIARQIVELHGGTIKVRSEGQGLGSTFQIHLPSIVSATAGSSPVPGPSAEKAPPRIDPRLLAGIDVLAVDDQEDARVLLEVTLSAYGATVRTADNAQAAFDAIVDHVPDILVSDLGMPHEDGFQLIRRVRQREAAGGDVIPAIAVTAYASAHDRDLAIASGYQAHVAKPFEPEELVRLVATFARGNRVEGP